MKRRNLFLSLISSVIVAVAIVTVTICTVIPKKKAQQGGNPGVTTPIVDVNDNKKYEDMNLYERDGSKAKPYVLYSAESFVDMLEDFGGTAGMHFEVVKDIDFAGYNYNNEENKGFVTLFNKGMAFKGNIEGNGFALNNITINVTTENLESDFSYAFDGNRYASIALFGEMEGSKIEELNINKLDVNVAPDVYSFISGAGYEMPNAPFAEMVVSGIAGISRNVTLSNVEVNAEVAGSAYIINGVSTKNSIGGVSSVAHNLTVKDSKIDVKIEANSGKDYLVGGVAGYAYDAEIKDSEITTKIETTASRNLIMAGVFGYARAFDGANLEVNFALAETASQQNRDAYIKGLTTDNNGDECLADAGKMSLIAGVVATLRANDTTQETNLSNINVNSTVDFDGVFAGAIFDVYSTNKATFGLVELHNIIVTADVNVLAVHGFARQLVATTVTYDNTDADGYYNIKITGNVNFEKYAGTIYVTDILSGETTLQVVEYHAATILVATDVKYVDCSYKDLFIQASSDIDATLQSGINGMSIRVGAFGSYNKI